MKDAHKAMERFDVLFWRAHDLLQGKEFEPFQSDFIMENKNKFLGAMDDDFNTPVALAALFELVNETNKFISQDKRDTVSLGTLYHAVDMIENFAGKIFGLFKKEVEKDLSAEDENLLQERIKARANKDFKRSDELRDVLRQHGIIVEDGKGGQTWRWA